MVRAGWVVEGRFCLILGIASSGASSGGIRER